MDFYEMHHAVQRALSFSGIQTSATGKYVETVVIDAPQTPQANTLTPSDDLVLRLLDQHEVRYDPLCKEAAAAIQSARQQLQINLSQLENALQILSGLYSSAKNQ